MKSKVKRFAEFLDKPTLQKNITLVLVIANAFVFSLYIPGWSFSKAAKPVTQDNKRIITKKAIPKDEPIEISDIKIKSKTVRLGELFEEEEEWLKNIDLKLKNKWNKAITYVVLNVDFPETQDTGSMMMYSLYLGQRPDIKSTLTNSPLHLEPNKSVDVSLAPRYEEIKKFIETRQPPIGNIHKITIWLDQVMFEDGTLYSGGGIFKRNPDPDSPRKWVPVTNEHITQHD